MEIENVASYHHHLRDAYRVACASPGVSRILRSCRNASCKHRDAQANGADTTESREAVDAVPGDRDILPRPAWIYLECQGLPRRFSASYSAGFVRRRARRK